ncbi:transposase for transposon Tn1546 [Arthrobacter sp. Hiyo4]|nr:transposase for transposon Tn1546 [Arthrobacter sp. Hiyo4]
MLTLLAALVHQREREITDTLVELLIATVHRIGARAERKVTAELINAVKRVSGKESILFSIAKAALEKPDDAVRSVVFPAVTGGEQTLRELVHEFKTKGPVYRRTVQTTLRSSYTGHYRRGLMALLEVLEFRSNNTAHRPVIDALALIGRHANTRNLTYFPVGESVPAHRGAAGDWADLVYKTDTRGRHRVARLVYEVVTFQALREQLRCREIWVVGACSWRNPDDDLPHDFDARRTENYRELRKPLDPTAFIEDLRNEMSAALDDLNEAVPTLDWLEITDRASGAIKLTKHEAAPEPRTLRRVKAEVQRRWGTVALIDILKEAVLRTGCLNEISAVAGGGTLPVEVLAERLMLAIYAYGTNTGIRAVAAGGGHGHTENEIRYVRRRYLTTDTAQAVAIGIANATFAARQRTLWGEGSTAVASDSTHFRSYDQNIFTEWHSRYGGRGILIYWHVERGSMVVHSQTLRASASEVHAMVEGAIRHGTTMKVEGNYVDTHGQSEIGFGITRLLGFDLLPRIKQVNRIKLYRPATGQPDAYPLLTPALTRPIRWDLVEQNYDQMIKYATAIKHGTASTEAILRRFTRSASHPTYQAMLEVGRAQRTIFVAKYLRRRELQREITEGLNVVEAFNGANSVIYYGKGGK